MHGMADELRRCSDCAGQVVIDALRLDVGRFYGWQQQNDDEISIR